MGQQIGFGVRHGKERRWAKNFDEVHMEWSDFGPESSKKADDEGKPGMENNGQAIVALVGMSQWGMGWLLTWGKARNRAKPIYCTHRLWEDWNGIHTLLK